MTQDGQIRLLNPSPENIAKANKNLESMATSYPTQWVPMPQYDVYSSKRLRAASKGAFEALLLGWIGGASSTARLIALVVAGYGFEYFNNVDEENLYYSTKYSYREVGPGRFDSIGNFMGDYQLSKVERVTKNSNYTGGDFEETIQYSTTLYPSF